VGSHRWSKGRGTRQQIKGDLCGAVSAGGLEEGQTGRSACTFFLNVESGGGGEVFRFISGRTTLDPLRRTWGKEIKRKPAAPWG